ncbi:hypothetical protein [uncultured Thiodictyon sp.]|uniref:hypothetical protein n=1 Tax=uncultured Thiodictyon sp. TaxID=1846217 RepID=UPI0025DB1F5E|nr:hypothetical protein [uncultured Thiodictyon sp.]
MLSQAAVDDLQRFAEQGRIGGVVELAVVPPRPEPGEMVTVNWDFSGCAVERGVLTLPDVGELIVQPRGQHRFRMAGEPIGIRLVTAAGGAEQRIEPQIVIPQVVELGAAGAAVRDEPVVLRWRAPGAQACVLRVRDADGVEAEFAGGAAGAIEYRPRMAGALRLELLARSRHADWSEAAQVRAEALVAVAQPPVRIQMDCRSVSGLPGDEIQVGWRVTESLQVRLLAVDREEEFQVSAQGAVLVQVGFAPERFRLIATGADGRQDQMSFTVAPRFCCELTGADDLLNLIHTPWQ